METITTVQRVTKAQLTKYLRAATCPYCGGRLSGHHMRSEDGWRSLPMRYRCTVCSRNPREALADENHEPAGQSPRPGGGTTMTPKKTEKAAGKKNGGDDHEETTGTEKGRVHEIAKPRSRPVTGREGRSAEDAPDASKIEATRTAEAKAPATTKDAAPQPDDASEIVVFAFRLSRSERDEIHAATGSAKASKFIRTLALAGARGDMKAINEAIDEVHTPRP